MSDWKKDLYWLLIWLLWNVYLNEKNLWDKPVIAGGEGPQACCSNSRGAQVELLLQVGDPHLSFLVKFKNLIC
jgi:hypothetical protein